MNVIIYGLGGTSKQYVALRYTIIPWKTYKIIDEIKYEAYRMRDEYPTVERVYAIYDRPGLRQEFRDSMYGGKNPIEARIIFKDTLERYGLRII